MPSLADDILPRTFVHVPGIGHVTEKSLWGNGITSWRKFLDSPTKIPRSIRSRRNVFHFIEQSEKALQNFDAEFFQQHLAGSEWWRLYRQFSSKTVFLDIETTGLSRYYDEITLVGLYDEATNDIQILEGKNLDRLSEILSQYAIVVTFNGTLFDLPFLQAKFPSLRLPPIHIDLRYVMKRLGYSGGLKLIEETLGMRRSQDVASVDGLAATVLWARYLRGDLQALEKLVKYNIADTTSLARLMAYSCDRLTARLFNRKNSTSLSQLRRPTQWTVSVKRVNKTGCRLSINQTKTFLRVCQNTKPLINVSALLKKLGQSALPKSVGIDLRASENRPTGWSLLYGDFAETQLLKSDQEIIQKTILQNPSVISIDSPLTLPNGRCCTKDSCVCRGHGILRECERTLWRRGVRVFPCLLPSMQKLTERGIRLATSFRNLGYKVIESYPGAAQDIMRIPRKGSSIDDLARGLGVFGIKGNFLINPASHDELDAITSAVVGLFFLSGDFEALGNEREEYLIIPKLDQLLTTK